MLSTCSSPAPALRALRILGKLDSFRMGPGKNYGIAIGVSSYIRGCRDSQRAALSACFLDAGHNPPEGCR